MYQSVLGTVAAGGEHPLIDIDGTKHEDFVLQRSKLKAD